MIFFNKMTEFEINTLSMVSYFLTPDICGVLCSLKS